MNTISNIYHDNGTGNFYMYLHKVDDSFDVFFYCLRWHKNSENSIEFVKLTEYEVTHLQLENVSETIQAPKWALYFIQAMIEGILNN